MRVLLPGAQRGHPDHKFKRGNEIINYNAREFSRELDSLVGDGLLSEGIVLDSGGAIIVNTNIKKDRYISELFWEDKPDHRILSVAYNMASQYGKDRVCLVSKDINLRMKAKSIGIRAEDYETGKVQNIDELYKGKTLVEGIADTLIEDIYHDEYLDASRVDRLCEPHPNEYFILRNNKKSPLLASFLNNK